MIGEGASNSRDQIAEIREGRRGASRRDRPARLRSLLIDLCSLLSALCYLIPNPPSRTASKPAEEGCVNGPIPPSRARAGSGRQAATSVLPDRTPEGARSGRL